MTKLDDLLVGGAALMESGQSDQMSLTVVTRGAVITCRPAPEAVWRQRVSEVLAGSAAWEASPPSSPPRRGGPARPSALPHGADPSGHGGDPGDRRDVPRLDRGRQRLDRGRLQLLRSLTSRRWGNRPTDTREGPTGVCRSGPLGCSGVSSRPPVGDGQAATGVPSSAEPCRTGSSPRTGAVARGRVRQVKPSLAMARRTSPTLKSRRS